MKSDDVRRAVKSIRHQRVAGDEPNIGRVARMPGTGIPKGERRRRRRGERGRKGSRFVVIFWSALIGFLALGLLGGTMFLWLRQAIDSGEVARKDPFADRDAAVRLRSQFESPSEEKALALVRSALQLRDDTKVPDLFHPAATSPEAIIRFLADLEKQNGSAAEFNWLGSMDANGLSIDGVLVTFERGLKPEQRMFFLTPDEKGAWKIDFDSLARSTTPSWGELLDNQASQAVVRVQMLKDYYYNGPFADDRQWVCYAFGSPDIEESFTGYCKVGSPQAAAVEWMFSKDRNVCRATLEIRRVEGAAPKQFEIVRVLAEDWVLGKVPFDEGF
jgi:hypothetical protein